MNPSDFYDHPRRVATHLGGTVESIRTASTALAGMFLVVMWATRMWNAWSEHGVGAAVVVSVVVTVGFVAIAIAGLIVSRMGKYSTAALLPALILLAAWPTNWIVLACTVPVVLMTISAYAESWRRVEQTYMPVEPRLLEQRIIGEPAGYLGDAVEKFGAANVAKGIAGEQLTNDTFSAHLDTYPMVQLVNGLRFPGSEKADIDHALVCGDKVALLDSKYWAGGTYQWGGAGLILSGRGHGLTSHETNFDVAVQRLTDAFTAENKQVCGWMVLHSNNGRPMNCVPPGAETAVLPTLVPGTDWLPTVMAWLTSTQVACATEELQATQCDTMKLVLDWTK
ncbi:nuclease-related domain-containing protein [Gordonia sp. VNK1]|uniref:nuclease-related domain-containing protein n=1 Tax=Gordonia oleivorans TaxID=3156618 RepID=UPI0032B4CD63